MQAFSCAARVQLGHKDFVHDVQYDYVRYILLHLPIHNTLPHRQPRALTAPHSTHSLPRPTRTLIATLTESSYSLSPGNALGFNVFADSVSPLSRFTPPPFRAGPARLPPRLAHPTLPLPLHRRGQYGKRLATCSSDRSIKIWSRNEQGVFDVVGSCAEIPEAHQGSVWKLAWAHPEFGQVLASCSFDNTVKIWEEQDGASSNADGGGSSTLPWVMRYKCVDSRVSVNDIKFAPQHLGLKLATVSDDGYVRIYEADDVMNLTHWQMQDSFEAFKDGVTCLSWNRYWAE